MTPDDQQMTSPRGRNGPGGHVANRAERSQSGWSFLRHSVPGRQRTLALIALLSLGSAVSVLNPWIAGRVTSNLLGEAGAAPSVWPLLLGWCALNLIAIGVRFWGDYLLGTTVLELSRNLKQRLYEHMQALPLSYHQSRPRGDTLSLLYSDAGRITGFFSNTVIPLVPDLLRLLGAFIVLFWISPYFALLIFLAMPLYYLGSKLLGRQLRPLSRASVEATSRIYAAVDENLTLLPVIKSFSQETREQNRLHALFDDAMQINRRDLLFRTAMGPFNAIAGGVVLLLVVALGAQQIGAGNLEASGLVSILLYVGMIGGPLGGLLNLYGQVQVTRGAAERIEAFFDQQPEPNDEGAAVLPPVRGDIEYDRVDFRYADRGPLLTGLNLSIRAGETVAITGSNGGGKSTLAHLLLRFLDPHEGQIRIDGHALVHHSIESIRRQIGLVSQHVLLMNGTVAENIAYGVDEPPTLEVLHRAAKLARADTFIAQLPQGFDTVIGDLGVRLSGGQQQRLALARALLRDPPILIFDEATAMFDPASETEFIEGAQALLQPKTVILITHRRASLALADRIYELRDGQLFVRQAAPDSVAAHGGDTAATIEPNHESAVDKK